MKYVYLYHLGNIRLSYTKNPTSGQLEIIEENNYYPFGLKHKGYNDGGATSLGNNVAQKFKYNGVELEESLGLNLYEMNVRSYDPAIARFTSIDPVTHHSMSTYTAFDNNPVFWADPSGADSDTFFSSSFLNKRGGHWTDRVNKMANGEDTNSTSNSISDNEGLDDKITVNSDGIVTNVEENEEEDTFFDEEGNQLFFNDPKNDFSIFNKWGVGDRLFFAISNKELILAIIKGGIFPNNNTTNINGTGYAFAGIFSWSKADFTFNHLVPTYFNGGESSYLEEGLLRTSYNSYNHFFRFGKTNNIYNLYDAGNYMWGSWMKLNGFTLGETRTGAHANSIFTSLSIDTSADQRSIKNGFNHKFK